MYRQLQSWQRLYWMTVATPAVVAAATAVVAATAVAVVATVVTSKKRLRMGHSCSWLD